MTAALNTAAEQPAPKRVARTSKSKTDSQEVKPSSRSRNSVTPADSESVTEVLAVPPVSGTIPVSSNAEEIQPVSAAHFSAAEITAAKIPTSAAIKPVRTSEAVDSVVASEDIARLAHSFWVERGYQHGSAEDDWFRAEQQLKAKAASAHA